MQIIKANGEKVSFDAQKLIASLKKAGGSDQFSRNIVGEIESTSHEGIHTKEIYKKAFALLRNNSRPMAAKYRLKEAVMQLGPSGFPFEKYIAEILKYDGTKSRLEK